MCAYLVGYWSNVGKINPLNAPFTVVDNADCLYLHDLALLKAMQGYGLGQADSNVAIDYALQNAAIAIALYYVQNSKTFWQEFGFNDFWT